MLSLDADEKQVLIAKSRDSGLADQPTGRRGGKVVQKENKNKPQIDLWQKGKGEGQPSQRSLSHFINCRSRVQEVYI